MISQGCHHNAPSVCQWTFRDFQWLCCSPSLFRARESGASLRTWDSWIQASLLLLLSNFTSHLVMIFAPAPFPKPTTLRGQMWWFSKIGLPFDPQLVKDGHKPNANLLHGWEWEVLGQVLGSWLLPRNRHMEEHRPGKVFNFLTFSSPRPDVHHALVF